MPFEYPLPATVQAPERLIPTCVDRSSHTRERGGYEVTDRLLAPEWQEIYEERAADIIRRL